MRGSVSNADARPLPLTPALSPWPGRGSKAAAAVILLCLTACTALAVKAPQTYRLEPTQTVASATRFIPADVLVYTPTASLSLDTQQVAFLKPDGTLSRFDGVAWTDRAPALVEAALVEGLQNSGLRGVAGHDAGIRPDYTIQSELRDFEATGSADGAAQSVDVSLYINIVRVSDRRIVASRLMVVSQPVATPAFGSVVAAFDVAVGDVDHQAADWVLDNVERNLHQQPGSR